MSPPFKDNKAFGFLLRGVNRTVNVHRNLDEWLGHQDDCGLDPSREEIEQERTRLEGEKEVERYHEVMELLDRFLQGEGEPS